MRLEKYLNEKFYDAFKSSSYSDETHEIFVNPSRKEIREIEDGQGVRGVVDFKNKKVYMWTYMVTHIALFAKTDFDKKMGVTDLRKMWLDGDGLGDTLPFTLSPLNSKMTESDLLMWIARQGTQKQFDILKDLLTTDFTWLNKYEGLGDKLKRQIEKTVKGLSKRL